jgi:hypothetical protein
MSSVRAARFYGRPRWAATSGEGSRNVCGRCDDPNIMGATANQAAFTLSEVAQRSLA